MKVFRQFIKSPKHKPPTSQNKYEVTEITTKLVAITIGKKYREKLSVEDVVKFFQQQYSQSFLLLNLSGKEAPKKKIHGLANYFDWEEHEAPTLELLFSICHEMANYLKGKNKKVVGVYCNHDKGRIGTVICCFLLYCKKFYDYKSAQTFYFQRRLQTNNIHCFIEPCQSKYLEYFDKVLKGHVELPRVMTIEKVKFKGNHTFENFYIKVKKDTLSDPIIFSKSVKRQEFQVGKKLDHEMEIIIKEDKYFAGDIKLHLKSQTSTGPVKAAVYSFNTSFLCNLQQQMLVYVNQLSLKKGDTISPSFCMAIKFKQVCTCPQDMPLKDRCPKCKKLLFEENVKWKTILKDLDYRNHISNEGLSELLERKPSSQKIFRLKSKSARKDKSAQKKQKSVKKF